MRATKRQRALITEVGEFVSNECNRRANMEGEEWPTSDASVIMVACEVCLLMEDDQHKLRNAVLDYLWV